MELLIDNCAASDFEFVCPKKWSDLTKSFVEGVRHCDQCNRKVYLCRTDSDIKLYDSLNYCIAISDTQYVERRNPHPISQIKAESSSGSEAVSNVVKFVGVWRRESPK